MFNSDVILMSVKHTQGCVRTQASHVKAGFTRCGACPARAPAGAMDHSHRLFDIFLSNRGNRQKKAEIWRKKNEY